MVRMKREKEEKRTETRGGREGQIKGPRVNVSQLILT